MDRGQEIAWKGHVERWDAIFGQWFDPRGSIKGTRMPGIYCSIFCGREAIIEEGR
jgi:hypothetical protein